MSHGYSLRICNLNAKADQRKLGVRLGRVCIAHSVPVAVVAERMGVTRATVYNWFCGTSVPQTTTVSLIEAYISSLENASA